MIDGYTIDRHTYRAAPQYLTVYTGQASASLNGPIATMELTFVARAETAYSRTLQATALCRRRGMRKPMGSFTRLFLGCGLWLQAALLAAAPAVLLEKTRLIPLDGAPEGGFGRAVAISGDVAVVSANDQPRPWGAGPEEAGAVYVFERDAAGVWRQTAKLTSGREGDLYGNDVAVDGNIVVVAAAHSRSTHLYEKISGTWQLTGVLGGGTTGNGNSVAVENGVVAIADETPHGMGLYRRGANGWAQIASYENGYGLADDDYFSPQADISQNVAIHGSWGNEFVDPPTPSTAFIYTAGPGGNWAQPTVTALTRPGGSNIPDGFSSQVIISGNTALISGYLFSPNSTGQWVNTGSVFGAAALDDDESRILSQWRPFRYAPLHLRNATNAWPMRAELVTSDAALITSVAINSGRALLASYPNNVYLFETPANLDRPNLQQDDFQDGDASGWATTPGSLFAVASSGTSRFYRQSSVTGNATALWQNPVTNDQAIQADVTPRAFDGTDRWFGLVVRYTDINNYYYVTARSGGGIQLKRMLAGAFTTLGSAALPVAIGTTHRIRLEAIGDHVRVLVNDRPVIRVRNSSLGGGVPGLMTYKTRADFDNVIVNANPAYLAFANDFETVTFDWETAAGSWDRVSANGSWVYRQGELTGGARVLMTGAYGAFGTQGDQIVQADLRPTAFSGADRWVGLIARYRNDANYHYVTLRSSGVLEIRKLVNGSIQPLASVPFTVQPNVSYRVRLEAIGTQLRVYVNGTLRAEASDSSLTRAVSSAGVASYKAALDVDNFSVAQP
jgi:hypothetical protein